MQKTAYELDLSAFMCHLQIKVNDVEILSLDIDGQTATDIPINQAILESGPQEIEVRATPLSGSKTLNPNAYISYKINVYDMSSGDYSFMKQLEKVQTPPVQEGVPLTLHKRTFDAEVPYVLDAWQHGLVVKDHIPDIKEQLIETYNKLISEINAGNYANFKKAISRKEQNTAKALYLSEAETNSRINSIIKDFQSGFKGKPVGNDTIVETEAYGKLVKLITPDGASAFAFENKETEEDLLIDIEFFLPPNEKALTLI